MDPTESGTQNTEDADSTQPSTQPPTQPPATTQPQTRPAFAWPEVERLQSEDVINILLIGKDASKSNERPRSDTMILLSINKKTNTLTLTSFMRDLYVQIPGGYSDNRINASFRFGGAPLLNATIEKNFGIVVDGNIEVDFNQFKTIIDILGGVDIELTDAEAKYLRGRGHSGLTAGERHLMGSAALDYCRIRRIDSDHQRTERQRKVLMSIAESARNMSVSQMMDLINQVLPHVYTDLSDSEIVSIATAAVKALSSGAGIQSGKVPQSGQYYGSMIMGMQVIVPDLVQCNQYLKAFIYGG